MNNEIDERRLRKAMMESQNRLSKPKIFCKNCGKETDTCWTDDLNLGLSHGFCQCRDCYIKAGHPECSTCHELLNKSWNYCPQCGTSRKEQGLMVQLREIERVWRCSKGHEIVHYKNEINMDWPISFFDSKPLCVKCLAKWLEANVPEMKEEIWL